METIDETIKPMFILDQQIESIKQSQHKVAISLAKNLILSNRDNVQRIDYIKAKLGESYTNGIILDLINDLKNLM